MFGEGGSRFLGFVVAGGIGVAVRDRSISVATSSYRDTKTVGG